MATLTIDGIGKVTVDDAFLKLSPEEQAQTVDEIAASLKGPGPETPPPVTATAQDKPPSQRGTFLDSFVGQGVLMGAGDEIKSAVRAGVKAPFTDKTFGQEYDQELANSRADLAGFRERNPYGSVASEIGGGVAGIAATGGAGLAARGATTLGKAALGAAEGAGYGAVQGFASGEGGVENRLESAAYGSAGGAAGGTLGGAIAGRSAQKVASKAVPTTSQRRDMGGAAFDAMRAEGVTLKPAASQKIFNELLLTGATKRMDPVRHPQTYAVMQHVARDAKRGKALDFEGAHIARQWLGKAQRDAKPGSQDAELADEMIDALDDKLWSTTVLDTAGAKDPARAQSLLREGIDNWRTAKKSEIIDKIFSDAEVNAGAKYTQAGLEHAIRDQFKALAKNDKKLRTFTAEEQKAIRNVAIGGKTHVNIRNLMRGIGKFAPRGPVSGGVAGYLASISPELAIPAWGGVETSKAIATKLSMNKARKVGEMVRGGSGPATLSAADKQKIRAAIAAGQNVPEEIRAMLDE